MLPHIVEPLRAIGLDLTFNILVSDVRNLCSHRNGLAARTIYYKERKKWHKT